MYIPNFLFIHANVKGNYASDTSGNKLPIPDGITANIDNMSTGYIDVDNDDNQDIMLKNILKTIINNKSGYDTSKYDVGLISKSDKDIDDLILTDTIRTNIIESLKSISTLGLVFDNTSGGHVGWDKDNKKFIDGDEKNNSSRLPFLEFGDDASGVTVTIPDPIDSSNIESYWNDPNDVSNYQETMPKNYIPSRKTKYMGEIITTSTVNTRTISGKFFSPTFINFLEIYFTGLQEIDIISCNIHDNLNIEDLPKNINIVRYTYKYLGNNNFIARNNKGDPIDPSAQIIIGSWELDKHYYKADNTIHFTAVNLIAEGNVNPSNGTLVGQNTFKYNSSAVDLTSVYFKSHISNYNYLLAIPGPVVTNITTPDDLYNLMASTNVVDMAASYTVANAIDMTTIDATWPAISIGNSGAAPFLGQFNGQNNLITIGLVAASNLYYGLFGRVGNTVNNGTLIQYINLSKTKQGYTISTNNAANELRVGVLCGYLQVGTIQNSIVNVDGTIAAFSINAIQTNGASTFGNYVGGLVGFAKGISSTLRAVVTNCSITFNSGVNSVFITSDKRGTSNSMAAGLIGYALCADITICTLSSNINGSFNIVSNCTVEAGNARVGGMFGSIDGVTGTASTGAIINNCDGIYNCPVVLTSTVVSGTIISGGYCGFTRGTGTSAGQFTSNISNSDIIYASDLTANNTNTATGSIIDFGGLTGRNQFSTINLTNITVDGSTTITSTNNGINNATTGGLCGTMLGNIISLGQSNAILSNSGCTYNMYFMRINSTNNNSGFQGGLVGYNISSKVESCAITCDSYDSIIENTTNSLTTVGYNGGLCGRLENGILTNSTINISSNTIIFVLTNGSGFAYSGGMIGFNFANTNVNNNILTYNNLIISANTTSGAQFVGGMVGNNDVNATLSLCNITINGYISINSINTSLDHFTGGIAGSNFTGSQISNCNLIVEGNTTIQSSSPTISVTCRTGGLVGVNENSVGSHIIIDSNVLFKGATEISSISGNTVGINRSLYTGGIVGFNILACDIKLSSIRCDSTALIKSETTSTINATFVGGIVGSNRNNGTLIDGCDATYNGDTSLLSSAELSTGTSLVGGIAGSNEDGAEIKDCKAIYNSTTTLTTTNPTNIRIGGIIGSLRDTLVNTITNNTVNYNGVNSKFNSTLQTITSATIGLLIGIITIPYNNITGNTATYKNYFKIDVAPGSNGIDINNKFANVTGPQNDMNNTTTFETFPMIFNTTTNGTQLLFETYLYSMPVLPNILTISGLNYNIDYSNLILLFYLRIPVPIIPVEAPCCKANLCTANPQTTDKDASVTTAKPGNLTMVTSVNNYYEGVSTGRRTAHSQPVFSSYQAYMQYLQGQNRR